MKAIGYLESLPITDANALLDMDVPKPEASGRDILVNVKAISVNPVDTKVRKGTNPPAGAYKILGWDATGVVEAVGEEVTLFEPGDKVWYAGTINRQGTNAEYHLVDERIAAKMPQSLDFAEAAALPLTGITAWELLFNRFELGPESRGTILIIGSAGGVGSIMIQLVKKLTQLKIIATASRPETVDWVKSLGADEVINHRESLVAELERIEAKQVNYIASLTHTVDHFAEIIEIIAPQGKIGLIEGGNPVDIQPLMSKSVSVHWELMFTRPLYETEDMIEQHHLLTQLANMIDNREIKTTIGENFGKINAANLRRAHALIESGKAKGKIVLSGF